MAAVLLLLLVAAVGLPSPTSFLLALATGWASVAVHEAGHAVMALAVGHRVIEVRVGVGPERRVQLAGIRFILAVLPAFGYCMAVSDDPKWYRVRRLLVGIAGMAVNAVVIWLVSSNGITTALEMDLAFWNGALLFGSLLPIATKTSVGPLRPDGLLVIRTLLSRPADLEEQRAETHAIDARLLADAGDADAARAELQAGLEHHPGSPLLRASLGMTFLDTHAYRDAREVFAILADPARDEGRTVEPHVRAIYLNNLAWADLMTGDRTLLEEAKIASARAIATLPAHPWIMRTRGFALICDGNLRDGVFLAEKAYAKYRDAKERAVNAAVISIGRARDWRLSDAARWLEEARRLDAQCPLLERAAAEIERRRRPAADVAAELGGPRPVPPRAVAGSG